MQCLEGHTIPTDGPAGLCPKCLADMEDDGPTPGSIGPFALLETLGEGGFGIVYRARHTDATDDVALKVPRALELSDARTLVDFLREPALSAKLSHDYVVRVLEVGEQSGVPYFTMEYMAGGTLRARMAQYRESPRAAAELMIRIADAVQYLHHDPQHPEREPILHRDLKPENILFDAGGSPRLSDFGIAKSAKGPTWTHSSRPAGCPAYMAPEQAFPSKRRELTAAADVYALGAILYELLTGRPPFDGEPQEILCQLKTAEAVPLPSRFVPDLDPRLESVVLRALEKHPAFRYRSAAAFAQDLALALLGKDPEQAPALPPVARLRRWTWYHPLRSAAGLWVLALVFGVGIGWLNRAKQLEQAQQLNASIAGMQAVAVNLQLKDYQRRVAELARDPEVMALLTTATDASNPSPVLLARRAPFDSMGVMRADGRQTARTTAKSAEYLSRSFAFRDYFRGAQALAGDLCREGATAPSADRPGAYVARAFLSESDGHFEFGLSAPLCRGRAWVGVLLATIGSDRVLGAVRVLDDHSGRITAVLGPRDRDRGGASLPLPNDLAFIVHPGLVKGQAQRLQDPDPMMIRRKLGISASVSRPDATDRLRYAAPVRVDRYRDPTPGYEGLWSAVFASADESGYVVAVASRRETSFTSLIFGALALPDGIPYDIGLLVLALATVRWIRRASPTN